VLDRQTRGVTLLDPASDGVSLGTPGHVEVSDDGRFAFVAATGAPVPPGELGMYLQDVADGTVTPINESASFGKVQFNVPLRALSADASRVAFLSSDSDLVDGDTNGVRDVFVRILDRTAPPPPPGTIDVELTGSGAPVSSGAAATEDLPLVVTVTPPTGITGSLTAELQSSDPEAAPGGYAFFGRQYVIDGPATTAAAPYQLAFTVDSSQLGGVAPADVQVFRDGVRVTGCTAATAATPDPCVVSRAIGEDGDAVLTVRTSGFSTWTVGRLSYGDAKVAAPLKPYDQVNRIKAGSVVPVAFTLPGARGFDVLAEGYPQLVSCTGAAVPAGKSVLTPVPFTKHFLLLWATPRGTQGCHDLVLRFRDGQEERVRVELR
jgi:hypothetical protein